MWQVIQQGCLSVDAHTDEIFSQVIKSRRIVIFTALHKSSNAQLPDPETETRISFLFARCRPTRPRCSAAGAGTAAAAAAAAAGAAVHGQFDDWTLIIIN